MTKTTKTSAEHRAPGILAGGWSAQGTICASGNAAAGSGESTVQKFSFRGAFDNKGAVLAGTWEQLGDANQWESWMDIELRTVT